ncbi:unnamed protein product [Rotaria magnacalcarata]|uniref:Uncharacterized protein n=1 Tax=Rotaria magnacalcarata TaxID=392030 RepID=A0A814X643_9BILA|nr:unnamed protein product [Rotaria magnacalcarata]
MQIRDVRGTDFSCLAGLVPQIYKTGHNEKPAVANDNGSSDKLFDSIIKLTDNIPFINYIRSFIDEIGEETNVLLGFMDEESLVNRRSRRAKFSSSSIKDDNTL